MLRKDFYFREIVTEGELDAAFDGVEAAGQTFAVDNDLVQKADNTGTSFSTPDTPDFNTLLGGIVKGLTVTISGLSATVSAGTAYDYLGRRINVPAPLTIDLSVTGDTALGTGGVPTGGFSTGGITAGQSRYILLMVYFNRLLSDPRTDGNATTVYFNRAESFQFRVKASNPSVSPTPPGGDPNCIILGAFQRNDSNAISLQNYSTRGDWIRTYAIYSASALPQAQTETTSISDVNFIRGTPRQAIVKLRNAINLGSVNYANHVSQSAPQDRHAAKNIDFEATAANWADTTNLPTVVGGGTASFGLQATINSIVSVLGNTTTGQGGTKKIGGASLTGSPVAVAAGTLRSQLQAIVDGLNTHLVAPSAHIATNIDTTPDGINLFGFDVQTNLNEIATGYAKLLIENVFKPHPTLNAAVPNIVQFDQTARTFKSGFGVYGMDAPLTSVNNSVDFGLADGGLFCSINASPADNTHWQITNGLTAANLLRVFDNHLVLNGYTGSSPFLDSAWTPQFWVSANNSNTANWAKNIEPQGTVKVAANIITNDSSHNHLINCTVSYPSSTVCRITFTGITFTTTDYIITAHPEQFALTGDFVAFNAKTTTYVELIVRNASNVAYVLTTALVNLTVMIMY